jgi:hypothetical protein
MLLADEPSGTGRGRLPAQSRAEGRGAAQGSGHVMCKQFKACRRCYGIVRVIFQSSRISFP